MTDRVRVPDLFAARARGDLVVEDQFFANLRLRNGVYKLTYRHRFDATLAATVKHARRIGARRVLDVACSSGVSTVELAHALGECEVHGTDVMTSATYLERGGIGWLVDDRDRVIQVDHPRWAMSWSPSKRDLLRHPLRAAHAFALRAARRRGDLAASSVSLVSSLVPASGVQIHEEDARHPSVPGEFELVRVANFLNRLYFAPAELVALRDAVVARVSDRGVLFVVRTHEDGRHHGTFFERRGREMIELDRIGDGSEVAAIIRGDRASGPA